MPVISDQDIKSFTSICVQGDEHINLSLTISKFDAEHNGPRREDEDQPKMHIHCLQNPDGCTNHDNGHEKRTIDQYVTSYNGKHENKSSDNPNWQTQPQEHHPHHHINPINKNLLSSSHSGDSSNHQHHHVLSYQTHDEFVTNHPNDHHDNRATGRSNFIIENLRLAKAELGHLRWRMALLAFFLPFGTYYTADFPATLGTGPGPTIQTRFGAENKRYTQFMNLALYFCMSYPAVFFSYPAGVYSDRHLRGTLVTLATLYTVGIVIFWAGAQTTNYPLVALGAVLESFQTPMLAARNALLARWFVTPTSQRGFPLAYATAVGVSRVASVLDFKFTPTIARDHGGVMTAITVGVVVNIVCLVVFAPLIVWLDRYGERKGCFVLGDQEQQQRDQSQGDPTDERDDTNHVDTDSVSVGSNDRNAINGASERKCSTEENGACPLSGSKSEDPPDHDSTQHLPHRSFSSSSSIGETLNINESENHNDTNPSPNSATASQCPAEATSTTAGTHTGDTTGDQNVGNRLENRNARSKHMTLPTSYLINKVKTCCRNLGKIPLSLWILSVVISLAFAAMNGMLSFARNYFQVAYGFSAAEAGSAASYFPTAAAVSLPIVGLLSDALGRRLWFIIIAISGYIFVLSMFLVPLSSTHTAVSGSNTTNLPSNSSAVYGSVSDLSTTASPPAVITTGCSAACKFFTNPKLLMSIFGVCYSMKVINLFSCVPLILPSHLVGTGYGVADVVYNTGAAIFGLSAGALLNGDVAQMAKVDNFDRTLLSPTDNSTNSSMALTFGSEITTAGEREAAMVHTDGAVEHEKYDYAQGYGIFMEDTHALWMRHFAVMSSSSVLPHPQSFLPLNDHPCLNKSSGADPAASNKTKRTGDIPGVVSRTTTCAFPLVQSGALPMLPSYHDTIAMLLGCSLACLPLLLTLYILDRRDVRILRQKVACQQQRLRLRKQQSNQHQEDSSSSSSFTKKEADMQHDSSHRDEEKEEDDHDATSDSADEHTALILRKNREKNKRNKKKGDLYGVLTANAAEIKTLMELRQFANQNHDADTA